MNKFEEEIKKAEAKIDRLEEALLDAQGADRILEIAKKLIRAWSQLAEKQRVYILNLNATIGELEDAE